MRFIYKNISLQTKTKNTGANNQYKQKPFTDKSVSTSFPEKQASLGILYIDKNINPQTFCIKEDQTV